MKLKIVGIKKQSYDLTSSGGPKFDGRCLNAVVLDDEDSNLEGCSVTTVKIDDSGKFGTNKFEVGKEYICYFNQKKQIDFISECK